MTTEQTTTADAKTPDDGDKDTTTKDTTTKGQKQYYHVLHCMIAEAQRPTDHKSMQAELDDLNNRLNKVGRQLRVPRDKWQAEVSRRLEALVKMLNKSY